MRLLLLLATLALLASLGAAAQGDADPEASPVRAPHDTLHPAHEEHPPHGHPHAMHAEHTSHLDP